jgi:hypothetical protein
MMDAHDIAARNAALVKLLGEKYGVRGRNLRQAGARAGRRLPKRLRAHVAVLAEAEQFAAVPKLAKRVDLKAVDLANSALVAHLDAIDVKDRRRGKVLGVLGIISAQILIVAAVFVWWLWWRDYI